MVPDHQDKALQPLVEKKRQWAIWVIPLTAIIITAWMAWSAWENRTITITVTFTNGEGIIAGRTLVRYNGLQVGTVDSVDLNPDLKGVTTTISLNRELKSWLTNNTLFWLVKPEISIAGISGLQALFSGNYITFLPKPGESRSRFEGLPEPPPCNLSSPGLHIILTAQEAGSLIAGSPVYSRGIEVGKIEHIRLSHDEQAVRIHALIDQQYASLVKKNSVFWNVSGLEISGPLSNLQLHMSSLLSLVKGGIAFSTPDNDKVAEVASQQSRFPLFRDFQAARTGLPIEIHFPLSTEIIPVGGRILFYGMEVGQVKNYKINKDMRTFTVFANINPAAEPILVRGARFWLVETKVTPTGIEGLNALLDGPYIAMDITESALSEASQETSFDGYLSRPPASQNAPGLHITLYADAAGGVSEGCGIWMRGIQIGTVEQITLKQNNVEINALISPRYQRLVSSDTRFWNASGFSLSAGLHGFKLRARPLGSVVAGGIFCETPGSAGPVVSNGHRYRLYDTRKSARTTGKTICLNAPQNPSLQPGSPVYYRGVNVGEVTSVGLADRSNAVEIQLRVNTPYDALLSQRSQFWNASGVQMDFSLFDGVKIRSESLQALALGGVAFATPPGDMSPKDDSCYQLHHKPKPEWRRWNPPVRLSPVFSDPGENDSARLSYQ